MKPGPTDPPPIDRRFRLDGQVALVTGAAGQLGRQFTRALALQGAAVAVSDVDAKACRREAEALRATGAEALPLPMDVADPASVDRAFKSLGQAKGRLDVLVNNAGIAAFAPFEERTYEEFMRVLAVNVGGTFLCTRAASLIMRRQPSGGRIVNIGSIYGIVSGDPRIYTDTKRNTSEVYAASKAGVIQMTRYFAVHLAAHHIRVNAISPGGVFNEQGPGFVDNYADRTPMGRMAREDELSGALLYFASDASTYTTGQNLVVDGGWTAW